MASGKTLAAFKRLEPGSRIVDVAGGDGRYALPLARAGFDVTILDVDRPHLEAAERRAADSNLGRGSVDTLHADIYSDGVLAEHGGAYDGMLIAGFIFHAPPDAARELFGRASALLAVGGLGVIEFNADRSKTDLEGRNAIPADDYLYSSEEALALLTSMYEENLYTDLRLAHEFVRSVRAAAIVENTKITASGVKAGLP